MPRNSTNSQWRAYQTYNCFDKLALMPLANSPICLLSSYLHHKKPGLIDQSVAFEEQSKISKTFEQVDMIRLCLKLIPKIMRGLFVFLIFLIVLENHNFF